MIIGIDVSRANKTNRSGVEWYSYHLIKQLYQLDQDNSYFLYTPSPLLDDLKSFPENFKEKVLNWPLQKFWTQGRLSLEILSHPPDVLFVPAHLFPGYLAKTNIITWPDIGHIHFPGAYSQNKLRLIEYGLSRDLKVADAIITVSEFSKNELVKYYNIDPAKISVIYLGYDENVFYPREQVEVDNIKQKYHLENNYLLYVGRLAKRKNLENLIEAYNQLRVNHSTIIDLVLIGEKDFDSQSVFATIDNSSYKNSIKTLGYAPEADLPALLTGAVALVHPSLFEGFGLTVLEAMACKCPVICSNSGSLPEIGQDAVEYFDPQNTAEISQKINLVLSDNQLRNQLIEKGSQRVKNFSWEKCAEETLLIFKK